MPSTFFLIKINTAKETFIFGPYINLLEADLINLNYLDLLFRMSKISSNETKLIELVECIEENQSIREIWIRASTTITGN